MPRRPGALPHSLSRTAFSVSAAREAGMTPDRLRARDLVAPYWGVRSRVTELSVIDRCRARMTRLPSYAAASHTTAAAIHRLPLPPGASRHDVLHFSVPRGARAPQGKGVRGHQVDCHSRDADHRRGILCTTPSRTFCDLATELTLGELVAAGDAILHRRLATHAELTKAVAAHAGRRGRAHLIRALELLDARAESPKESELRVLLIDAGLTPPAVQHVVRTTSGTFIARVDLAFPAHKVAIEYEGDHHRDRAQWRRDLARRRLLEAEGWIVIEVTQDDLDDPAALLSALARALSRPSAR